MKSNFEGRAWVFGTGITTDDILPGQYLDRSNAEVGEFCMAGVDPNFAAAVQPGDIIVAGPRFGTGSGRESAPYAVLGAGVSAVIAPSFARLFFRNAINIGLPPIVCPDIDQHVRAGDRIAVDLRTRTVGLTDKGVHLPIENLTGISLQILKAGGIIPYVKHRDVPPARR